MPHGNGAHDLAVDFGGRALFLSPLLEKAQASVDRTRQRMSVKLKEVVESLSGWLRWELGYLKFYGRLGCCEAIA